MKRQLLKIKPVIRIPVNPFVVAGFSLGKLKLAATGPVARPITHELSGKRIKTIFLGFLFAASFFTAPEAILEGNVLGERIGLYSDSFDPFHRGHLAIALAALKQLSLDRLYVMPKDADNLGQPNHSSLKIRYEMLRAALAHVGEKRIIPVEKVYCKFEKSLSNDPNLRFLQFAKERHQGACFFSIIDGDSVRAVLSNGFSGTSENHVMALFEGADHPLPDKKAVEPFLRLGVLKIFSLGLPPISSSNIRKKIMEGDFGSLSVLLPDGVLPIILKRGLYGAFRAKGWPHALLNAREEFKTFDYSKGDSRVFPVDLVVLESVKIFTERKRSTIAPQILPLLENVPHSLGNVDQYLSKHLTSLSMALLARKDLPVSLYYGPLERLNEVLAKKNLIGGIKIVRNSLRVDLGFFLVRDSNGALEIIIGGVYGETRFLHTQALIAKAMILADRSLKDLSVYRYKNSLLAANEVRLILRNALSDIQPFVVDAAVIGYHGVLRNGMKERFQTWKRFPSSWSVFDHRLADKLRMNQDSRGISWPNKKNDIYDLPHTVFKFRNSQGQPRSFLVTRNVYGDQFGVLLDILAHEKKIPRIIAFGNAGGIGKDIRVGDLVHPTQVFDDGRWRALCNRWRKPPPFWLNSIVRPTQITSVFSPLVETEEYIKHLLVRGTQAIEVELQSALKVLKNLASKGWSGDFSALLIISDIPGSENTLSDLNSLEPVLLKSKKDACDRILWELDVASPLEIN